MRTAVRCGLIAALLIASTAAADESGSSEPVGATCAFSVSRVDDLRPDTGSLGDANGRPLAGDALASLRKGLEAMPGHSETPAALHLQIDLLKAYVQGLSTLKTANVVARVRYGIGEATLEDHVYRGTRDGTNWFNTDSEWLTTFASAQQNLLGKIANDIGRLCPSAQGTSGPQAN